MDSSSSSVFQLLTLKDLISQLFLSFEINCEDLCINQAHIDNTKDMHVNPDYNLLWQFTNRFIPE